MLQILILSFFVWGGGGAGEHAEPQTVQYANWRRLRLPCTFQTDGAAPIVGLRLWWTLDGGNSWEYTPATGTLKPEEFLEFSAPRDGSYGFWLQVFDAVGHASPEPGTGDEPTMKVVVDTTAPAIEFLSPGEQEGFYAAQVIELCWAVHDDNLPEAPLRISFLRDGEDTPIPLEKEKAAYPAQGTLLWPLPLAGGTVTFHFSAMDRAGNRREERRGPYEIHQSLASVGARGVFAEGLSRYRLLPVFYRFSEIDPADVGAVELYWSGPDTAEGGGQWQLAAIDDDRSSPILFRAPCDGLFGLSVAVKARDGKTYLRPPAPIGDADVVTLVDTHAPQVEILSVNGITDKEVWIQAGTPVEIEFVVREENLPEQAAALDFSLDQGSGWHALAEDLSVDSEVPYRYMWTVPLISSDQFLVRACATDRVGRTGYGAFRGTVKIRDSADRGDVDAAKLIQRGRFRLSQGTQEGVKEAIALLKTAVGFAPASAEARYALAKALLFAGSRPEALTHLRKAVALLPAHVDYRLELVEQLLAASKKENDHALAQEAASHLEHISLEEMYARSDFWLLRGKFRAAEQALAELDRRRAERLEEEK